jgi:hypothetical protein
MSETITNPVENKPSTNPQTAQTQPETSSNTSNPPVNSTTAVVEGGMRTQFESRKRGAPKGNRNASKRLKWLESYDLSSPEGVRAFLAEVARATWTGVLGSRQASALNGTVRLLLDNELLPELNRRLKALEGVKAE